MQYVLLVAATVAVCLGIFIPILVRLLREQAVEADALASRLNESLRFQTEKANWAIQALRVATKLLGPQLGSDPLSRTEDVWTRWFRAHLLVNGSWLDSPPELDFGSGAGRWIPDWRRQRGVLIEHRSRLKAQNEVELDPELARLAAEFNETMARLAEVEEAIRGSARLQRLKAQYPNRYRMSPEVQSAASYLSRLSDLAAQRKEAEALVEERLAAAMSSDGVGFPDWSEFDRPPTGQE